MSQCFRTISSKFPPFVGTKKQFTQMNRQLPKHIKCSTFLEEFLGSRNILNTALTLREVSNEIGLPRLSSKDQLISSLYFSNNSVFSSENVQESEAKFKETPRFHIRERNPTEINDNWRNKQKFLIRRHKDSKEDLFKRFSISNKSQIHQIIPPDIQDAGIVLIDGKVNLQEENRKSDLNVSGKPSQEQLELIFENLKNELPHLFVRTIDYSVYNPNVVFVNNIRGTVSTGLFQYIKQIALLKTLGHIKFAYVKLEVLKITMHPEDDSVKVRWRINGLAGYKVFMKFWKYNVLKIRESLHESETWYDGFSTFYVGDDGKIYKHVADKMMPDQDTLIPKNKNVVAKLALFLGLKNLRRIFTDVSNHYSHVGQLFFQSEQKGTLSEHSVMKVK